MHEFGEGLIIESYKVPWLIWIQLLVMILIVLLLFFGFSVFTLDLPDNSSPNSSAAGPSSSAARTDSLLGGGGRIHGKGPLPITSSSRRTNQGQDQKHSTEGGVETSTSRGIRIGEERDGSSVKDATHFRIFERPQHPCHYLGLAKQAFLKCLGLDSTSDRSDRRKHDKED
ncbi:PREDICTED: uncharacterized protein LOC109174169 [Ipomoea nil]|uniref:uncharacterized protein LOC109174169 n=1 Tax=Ipomoea nil TaxID=35883 RepID=UPI000900EEA2|nr:PREDICTED: uncharacterized protein LOC109174169 [Ipomoea nil]